MIDIGQDLRALDISKLNNSATDYVRQLDEGLFRIGKLERMVILDRTHTIKGLEIELIRRLLAEGVQPPFSVRLLEEEVEDNSILSKSEIAYRGLFDPGKARRVEDIALEIYQRTRQILGEYKDKLTALQRAHNDYSGAIYALTEVKPIVTQGGKPITEHSKTILLFYILRHDGVYKVSVNLGKKDIDDITRTERIDGLTYASFDDPRFLESVKANSEGRDVNIYVVRNPSCVVGEKAFGAYAIKTVLEELGGRSHEQVVRTLETLRAIDLVREHLSGVPYKNSDTPQEPRTWREMFQNWGKR